MRKHYEMILAESERRVALSIKNQVKDAASLFDGGFIEETGLVQPKYAIYRVTTMLAVYMNEESKYYHQAALYERMLAAFRYIEKMQHENGLFDYIDCNFNSAPDTAFCIKRMLPCFKYLSKKKETKEEENLYEILYRIIKKGAYGLCEGGFHTPNHRWAIASNLLECAHIFNDEKMENRAQDYLMEGIDCNEDGEFAEKSAGNYNRINDDAMMTLGELSGDERYFEYAKRNLRMMLTYIEPDGSIFTNHSTRQDNGKKVFPKDYYLAYLKMGMRDHDDTFLGMANYIFDVIEREHLRAPDILVHFMLEPKYTHTEYDGVYHQQVFNSHYKESGIVRAHQNGFTYTLMQGKTEFLYFRNPSIIISMKIGGSFCEHRAFKADRLEKTLKGYKLHQTMSGWYYLLFKEKPETTDWWQMDQSRREKLYGPDLHIEVEVEEKEEGIDVDLNISGVELAPFRVEIAVIGVDEIENEHFVMPCEKGKTMILKQGKVRFKNRENSIEMGPGFGRHQFIEGKFGSEERGEQRFTLYFTDYTAFHHKIEIRNR